MVERKNHQFTADFIQSQPSGKVYHKWEQSQVECNYYIEHLTNIGDVVCDPFLGSGTTGLSASSLNRKFIGIEKDIRTYGIAKSRITNKDGHFH